MRKLGIFKPIAYPQDYLRCAKDYGTYANLSPSGDYLAPKLEYLVHKSCRVYFRESDALTEFYAIADDPLANYLWYAFEESDYDNLVVFYVRVAWTKLGYTCGVWKSTTWNNDPLFAPSFIVSHVLPRFKSIAIEDAMRSSYCKTFWLHTLRLACNSGYHLYFYKNISGLVETTYNGVLSEIRTEWPVVIKE